MDGALQQRTRGEHPLDAIKGVSNLRFRYSQRWQAGLGIFERPNDFQARDLVGRSFYRALVYASKQVQCLRLKAFSGFEPLDDHGRIYVDHSSSISRVRSNSSVKLKSLPANFARRANNSSIA